MPDGSCASKCPNNIYYIFPILSFYYTCVQLLTVAHLLLCTKYWPPYLIHQWKETTTGQTTDLIYHSFSKVARICFSSPNRTENFLSVLQKFEMLMLCNCRLLGFKVSKVYYLVCCVAGQIRGLALWLTVSMGVRKFKGKFAAFVPQLVYNSVQMEKRALVSVKFIHKQIIKMKM